MDVRTLCMHRDSAVEISALFSLANCTSNGTRYNIIDRLTEVRRLVE